MELLIAIFLMINYYKDAWKKAFQFKGVANRKEYWYWFFVLANILVTIIINLIIGIFNFLGIGLLSQIIGTIFPVFVLRNLIVNISISVRRLRDLGKRGGWIFIQLIPFLGFLYFMFLMSLPTKGLYDKWFSLITI